MSRRQEKAVSALAEARNQDNEHVLAQALWDVCEMTPLFATNIPRVEELSREARDLGVRTVLLPRQEVGQIIKSAEIFLARGNALAAFKIATEACGVAEDREIPALEDWAWMVSARALVRLGRQDDAVTLFEKIVERELPAEQDEAIVPGLSFLAVGEAHLFEGRYEGAYGPLQQTLEILPSGALADRYRYDALVGLGMLEHRAGQLDAAAGRYRACLNLADRHESRPEQVESLLLQASLVRGQNDAVSAHLLLRRALELSPEATPPAPPLEFPTERLRNVVGCSTVGELIDACMDTARHCGAASDLMGYVQLTAIVAALMDFDGRPDEARELLRNISSGLFEGGQQTASAVLRTHLSGY